MDVDRRWTLCSPRHDVDRHWTLCSPRHDVDRRQILCSLRHDVVCSILFRRVLDILSFSGVGHSRSILSLDHYVTRSVEVVLLVLGTFTPLVITSRTVNTSEEPRLRGGGWS